MSATKQPLQKRGIRTRKIIPLLAAFSLFAAGCGFRGPLYLPDEGPGEENSRPAAESTEAADEEAAEKKEGKQARASG